MNMEQSVTKRRHIKFRRGGIAQKKHTTCCQKLVSVRLHIQRCNYSHIYEHFRASFHETRRRCQSLCLGALLTPGRRRMFGGNAKLVTWYDFFRLSQFYKKFHSGDSQGCLFLPLGSLSSSGMAGAEAWNFLLGAMSTHWGGRNFSLLPSSLPEP